MRTIALTACYLTVALSLPCARAVATEPFELRDGDRVALIGNTFIEREQQYGYLETLLRTRWPERKITFRNLGWSGDTVFGHARGYFDGADKGFARLNAIVHELRPTVIFIGYGMGESFDGAEALPRFRQGLEGMLDMLKDLDARIVMIGPIRHENLGAPLPDPADHNRLLRVYADAMADIANSRGLCFIDLYALLGDGAAAVPPAPLTDNGIHLTPYGYWRAAGAILHALGLEPGVLTLDAGASKQLIPPPPSPHATARTALPGWERKVVAKGLREGTYALSAQGQPIATASHDAWAQGVEILDDPASRRAEKIRELTVLKNIQYFNQWRPANEPYIFGFRKQEQKRNRIEMPRFTEPIEGLEDQITQLAQPIEMTYELKLVLGAP